MSLDAGRINNGYGEYIVFRRLADGSVEDTDYRTFITAYQVIGDYTPTAMSLKGRTQDDYINRFELIKADLQKIDPSLEVAFIPLVLYELIFVRKYIEKLLKEDRYWTIFGKLVEEIDRDNHDLVTKYGRCYLQNEISPAFKLNRVIIKTFKKIYPSLEDACFTYGAISQYVKNEIDFLKKHKEECQDFRGRHHLGGHIVPDNSGVGEKAERIIRKVLEIECSEDAKSSVLLYRGSNFEKDSPLFVETNASGQQDVGIYNLSYGTSLFAGCVKDSGAVAFYYMRGEDKCGHIMRIPFHELASSPFYIPNERTIEQPFARGEFFHARTKLWKKDSPDTKIRGVQGGGVIDKDNERHLLSTLSREEFLAQFEKYKQTAIQVK